MFSGLICLFVGHDVRKGPAITLNNPDGHTKPGVWGHYKETWCDRCLLDLGFEYTKRKDNED